MDYILEKVDFKDLIKDMDYLILGEDLSQFNAYSSINMAKLAKRYNDKIKIIFLHDDNNEDNYDKTYFDYIYKYHIESGLDRNSLLEKIRQLAGEINNKYLTSPEN